MGGFSASKFSMTGGRVAGRSPAPHQENRKFTPSEPPEPSPQAVATMTTAATAENTDRGARRRAKGCPPPGGAYMVFPFDGVLPGVGVSRFRSQLPALR